MIDGDINEFLEKLRYGDEFTFLYRGKKYFLDVAENENGKLTIYLWTLVPPADDYTVILVGDEHNYPLEEFLAAKIWDGKTFMEVESEIQWVDD
ncbi:MAG: hypothetical protein LUE27_08575 [Clostridia bacterium]|nr:hypothetical protein [Clostridia bacterium]